jgi:hypothetical protein
MISNNNCKPCIRSTINYGRSKESNNTAIRCAAEMAFDIVVFVAALAVSAIFKIGMTNMSYAQVTPGQNPMCNPGDTHINGTESRAFQKYLPCHQHLH